MSDLKYQSSEWERLAKEMHEDENYYTISERLELTLGNIKHQENLVLWYDIEKLEEVLERVQELEKHFEEYQQIIGEETISRRSI